MESRDKSLSQMKTFLAILFALASQLATATQITVKLQTSAASYFDYRSSTYVSMAPISGSVWVTFDLGTKSITDYGDTTITQFGDTIGAQWVSPFTNLIPNDPFTGSYGNIYNSYAFPNVSDYASNFIEQGAAQANGYGVDGLDYKSYHIEFRASRYSQARNGNGTSDYGFTASGYVDFLRSFIASGEPVYFNESYSVYSIEQGVVRYSEGKSWSSHGSRIVEVIDTSTEIASPATSTLMIFALGAVGLSRRNRMLSLHPFPLIAWPIELLLFTTRDDKTQSA